MKFKRTLLINSKDRTQGDINNFRIVKNFNLDNIDYIGVYRFYMINNIYPINSYNNTLTVGVVSTTGTITITEGNYNATQLITEIINQLNTLGFSTVFSGSFNNITDKVTITSTVLNITSISGTLAPIIGFNASFTPSLTVTGNNPVNISYTQFLNFSSSYLTKYNQPNIKTDNINPYLYNCNINFYGFGQSVKEEIHVINKLKWNRSESISGFDIQVYDDNNNLALINNSEFVIELNLYSNE